MAKRSGRAAARAGDRARLRQHRREIAAIAAAADTQIQADPVLAAQVDAATDATVQAIGAQLVHGQARRLDAAGWVCVKAAPCHLGAGTWDHRRTGARIVNSVARQADGLVWGHTSVSHITSTLPSWAELRDACWLLYPDLGGIVVVAAQAEHVDIAEVHHVWTCLEGPMHPDFRILGQI